MAVSLSGLAIVECYLDAPVVARQLQARALAILEKVAGPEHPSLAAALVNLGELDVEAKAFAEAKAHFERGLSLLEQAFGPGHPDSEVAPREAFRSDPETKEYVEKAERWLAKHHK